MTDRKAVIAAVVAGAGELAAAGVRAARHDAECLAAWVLGVDRSRLLLVDEFSPDQLRAFRELIAWRAARIPLQHLVGTAHLGGVDVAVGPGVFVPRPETELLFAWALPHVPASGLVVDLCTGSGALALAIAHARPTAQVHAVEVDPSALDWARRNIEVAAPQVVLHHADVTDPGVLAELSGRVDVVVSNPPYVPAGAVLEPEVADHDPHLALFAGPTGLDVIDAMVTNIARLLRPHGMVAIEHDDSHGAEVVTLLRERGFDQVVPHRDLAGKPRFVTARRDDAKMA